MERVAQGRASMVAGLMAGDLEMLAKVEPGKVTEELEAMTAPVQAMTVPVKAMTVRAMEAIARAAKLLEVVENAREVLVVDLEEVHMEAAGKDVAGGPVEEAVIIKVVDVVLVVEMGLVQRPIARAQTAKEATVATVEVVRLAWVVGMAMAGVEWRLLRMETARVWMAKENAETVEAAP